MRVSSRAYRHERDYEAVARFLTRTYVQEANHRGWPEPRWEYMHAHPDQHAKVPLFERFGVWEDDGEMVGLVHFEDRLGVCYVQLDSRYPSLQADTLAYAEQHLAAEFKVGTAVHVYIDDADEEFRSVAASRGFEKMDPKHSEVTSRLEIPAPFPEINVRDGFRLTSLADEFDVEKVHRCMHRGFNHEGEPPADGLEGRRIKLNSPNFRRDLTMAAVAPSGDFVAFCGIWPVPESTICYIEPVATDPDYRRMGLGTAVVMEAVRRCAIEGATIAVVGSEQEFYQSMGFVECRSQSLWRKVLQPTEEASR